MTSDALVLGIESSCDETAAAVVRDGRIVLSNVIASQTELHAPHRGVVPEIASRSHMQRMLPILHAALAQASIGVEQLDAIAVTNRPGMIGCLLVGITAAKTLAWQFEKPLVGVDHVQAHIHAAFMVQPDAPLPMLALVASGGHTALYRVDAPGYAERLGATRDDAAGEALDKGAAMLGLPYPGGPAIEQAAAGATLGELVFPRALLGPDSLDFSFSGVKTSLLQHLRRAGIGPDGRAPTPAEVRECAAAYQAAIVDVMVTKLARAAQACGARSLSIGGGVARNTRLREQIAQSPRLRNLIHVFPPFDLCSDNAAMVAGLGTVLWREGRVADLTLEAAATAARTSRAGRG